jgi:hypothetical protein
MFCKSEEFLLAKNNDDEKSIVLVYIKHLWLRQEAQLKLIEKHA